VTGGSTEATGTPRVTGGWSQDGPAALEALPLPEAAEAAEADAHDVPDHREPGTIDGTRFAHASEAEMARILDFYEVRWEYEPTTFPILWNLDGEVVESFAPDFYLPELELFLEMTTLKQRLVRKKNRKLRRLRELYPGIRIKLFYARDFRAMMLKYGRLALAEALSGTPGQVVSERAAAKALASALASARIEAPGNIEAHPEVGPPAHPEPPSSAERVASPPAVRAAARTRRGRRRRPPEVATQAGAEQETGA
jgi:hypothetical protein